VTAWLAVTADRWDCSKCPRGYNYKCPKKHDIDTDEIWETLEAEERQTIPLIFLLDQMSICPRCLMDPWSSYIWQAFQWQDSGGDLGVSFADAPVWLREAFGILAVERNQAMKLQRESERK